MSKSHKNSSKLYPAEIVGGAYRQLKQEVAQLAKHNINVLFLGETGCGKELFAQHYMASSARGEQQRTVNCAAFLDTLLNDEVFGHIAGAFSGATGDRKGLIGICNGGILFLDELGDASDSFQAAILRVAEASEKNQAIGEHEIHVLDGYENRNISELIERCGEMRGLMKVQKFYGDTDNLPMMRLMRNSKAAFSLCKAPFIDKPDVHEFYLSLIRQQTSETKKVLNFGDKRFLSEALDSLYSVPAGGLSDFPQIAALGYALSALVLLKPQKPMPLVPSFEPLDPEVGY
jgi:hypothetical protein